MIYYLLLPVFSLLLLTIQVTVLDILSFGKTGLEISLILVVYAGFYLSTIRGIALSFVLGFSLDCITGVVPGFFVLSYVLIFLISKGVSLRLSARGMVFTMGFIFVCVLFEKSLIILIYRGLYGINVFYDILNIALLQAVAAGVFAPAFFGLFHRLVCLLEFLEARSPDRL